MTNNEAKDTIDKLDGKRYNRRLRYRDKHDLQKEVTIVLDLALSSTRLGICHTQAQVKALGKQLAHKAWQKMYGKDKDVSNRPAQDEPK